MVESLWPDLPTHGDPEAPVAILNEQAAVLGSRTGGLIGAKVRSRGDLLEVEHDFQLIVPQLDDYVYTLMTISHRLDKMYPVQISAFLPDDSLKDLGKAENLAQFKENLKRIFASPSMIGLLKGLLSQVKKGI